MTDLSPDSLQSLLESHRVPELKALAGLLAPSLPTRKAELIATIAGQLRDPERLRALWEALDDVQQAAVSEVLHGGPFDGGRFHAKYGRSPDWGTSRYPSSLHLFVLRGVIPRELRAPLHAFVPPPRPARVQTMEEAPESVPQRQYDYQRREWITYDEPVVRLETERAALHDLVAVLRLIDAGKVRASAKTHRVTSAGARAVAEVLYGGDFYALDEPLGDWGKEVIGPIKAFAWPLLAQASGLAELAGTRLQLTAAGRKALTVPPHRALRRAWDRWLKNKLLDELNRVEAIKGQRGKGRRSLTAVADRRAAIVATLQSCPAGAWIGVDELFRFMHASGRAFGIGTDLWSLYIGNTRYGSLGYISYDKWPILQGRYTLALLFEYAAALGLIDVAYIHPAGARADYRDLWGTDDFACLSRYDGLLYLRINNLGAWCLGQVDAYVPTPFAERPALKVLPNLDVVATEPLSPGDVLYLELFAEPTSDVVWAIRRDKVLESIEGGGSAAEMVAFLEAKGGGPLPGNVATLFAELGERATRLVHRGPALLIEAQDAALALLIANETRTRSLCMLAGERHLVVPADAEAAFRRALHELGYALSVREV